MSNDTIWDGPEAQDLRPLKDIVAENFALRQRVEELEALLLDYEEGVKSKEWANIVKDAERVEELQEMRDACDEYLKDGETPLQCIERWRNDTQRMMKMLADVTDDANRYRWLRDDANDVYFWIDEIPYLHGEEFDQAIDAARASAAGEN